jgi:restriction system protein
VSRRGFFAELNYQAQQAEKRRRQQAVAASRASAAAAREAQRARQASERAALAAGRANAAQQKEAQRVAVVQHVAARMAEVAALNAELAQQYQEIDGLLAATLGVDDFVDLESLKVKAQHPPFEPGALATPVPAMPTLVYPPEPVYQVPPAPTGLAHALGGKKKYEELVAQSRAAHETTRQAWHAHCNRMYSDYMAESARRQQAEQDRLGRLAQAEESYRQQCQQGEADATAHNQQVSKLINDLAFDVASAIEDYVGIVLSNSVYPDTFPVEYEHRFDLSTRELTLVVTVPGPDVIPAVKEYRYGKVKDEISEIALPLKEQKERYADVVFQVALRTVHEIFEADRAGKIRSVALTVSTSHVSPATGLPAAVPLVVVAADRETFSRFALANVVPHATLTHLGAAMSKSPFDLTPADTSAGVRVRGR